MKKIIKTLFYSICIFVCLIILSLLCSGLVAFIDGLTGYDLISKKYIANSLYGFSLIFLATYFNDKI